MKLQIQLILAALCAAFLTGCGASQAVYAKEVSEWAEHARSINAGILSQAFLTEQGTADANKTNAVDGVKSLRVRLDRIPPPPKTMRDVHETASECMHLLDLMAVDLASSKDPSKAMRRIEARFDEVKRLLALIKHRTS